jgi:hypothetical protein
MRIQGRFDFTDNTWKDDSGNNLTFTQFVTQQYIPVGDHALYIKNTNEIENFTMGHRRGSTHQFITVCIV